MLLPPAQYAPDQPILAGASDRVLNVLPRTDKSYGPWRSLVAYSSALDARAQGAATVADASENVNVFAGTAAKLHRLVGSSSFSDVSKVGGYSTASTERWGFAQYGERVIATNFVDPPQSFVMGSSSVFADMITTGITSLRARHVAVVKEWVVFLNTTDTTDGARPQRVHWLAIDNPTEAPVLGTSNAREKQSDAQDVYGLHGWGTGIVGNLGSADAALFFRGAVYRMDYVGPPAIFAIRLAQGVRGCPAPGSIIPLGEVCYFLGEDGFYRFDGARATPIGKERVDLSFFGDVDQTKLHLVSGAADPLQPILYWSYPRNGLSIGNRILAYNWSLDRWSITDSDDVQVELLLSSRSLGTNIDAIGGLVDSYTQLVDDRQFTGGRSLLAAFDASHKLAYFSGPSLAAKIDTQDASLVDGRVAHLSGARVILDGAASTTLSVGGRMRADQSPVFGPAHSADGRGLHPAHCTARYHRGRVTVPAGSTWNHFAGLDVAPENVRNVGS